ncbi:MAG: hypothetical protein CMC96_10470 [Flavobacteriales bacterium]|nr:hypothetical protein [Flavobacteriales bacterium]
MKVKFFLIIFTIYFFSTNCIAQSENSTCYTHLKNKPKKISLGLINAGIGFGGFKKYNGLNLSLIDKTCKLNGVGFCIVGQLNTKKIVNGFDLGLIHSTSSVNGIFIGALFGAVDYNLKGISFTGLLGDLGRVKGVNIVGGLSIVDQMKGVSITGVYSVYSKGFGLGLSLIGQSFQGISNGLYVSGLIYKSEKTNGVSISSFNFNEKGNGIQIGILNHSKQFNGVQFGLVNIIKENPKLIRILPLINANLSKDPIQKIEKDTIIEHPFSDTAKLVKEYYPSGRLKKKAFISKNKSYHVQYYENGSPKEIVEYKNEQSTEKTFYKNGVMKSEITYSQGLPVESYWIYDRKGDKKEERDPNKFYPKSKFHQLWIKLKRF